MTVTFKEGLSPEQKEKLLNEVPNILGINKDEIEVFNSSWDAFFNEEVSFRLNEFKDAYQIESFSDQEIDNIRIGIICENDDGCDKLIDFNLLDEIIQESIDSFKEN